MKITKAIITAAGADQRALPLQTLVGNSGPPATYALRLIVDEAIAAGVKDIAVVVHPGDEAGYREATGDAADCITFIPQTGPRGYGHSILCARDFTEGQPFLHLVGDHLPISITSTACAKQVTDVAEAEACSVSAVQPTRENYLTSYGTIGGRPEPGYPGRYLVERVVEKPTPTVAEQDLVVPGLRAGYYLCFFGIHVLTPAVMDILDDHLTEAGPGGSIQLTPALRELCRRERYFALDIEGQRYDLGQTYGTFYAQLALALRGKDRDEVLAQIVELLATRTVPST
jgi:UTP--glucose-1-phosphate uridylyltransferase